MAVLRVLAVLAVVAVTAQAGILHHPEGTTSTTEKCTTTEKADITTEHPHGEVSTTEKVVVSTTEKAEGTTTEKAEVSTTEKAEGTTTEKVEVSTTEKSHQGGEILPTTEKPGCHKCQQHGGQNNSTTKKSFKSLVHKCEAIGKALHKIVKKQWAIRTSQQSKNITAAEKSQESLCDSKSLKGVKAAFKVLNKVEKKIIANVTSFAKLQLKQTQQIVKNYTTLLKAHLKSKSTDEQSIHTLRTTATNVINSWVPLLSEVHQYAHVAFESTVRKQAEVISKKYEHPVNDEVRVAITNAGINVLNVLVQQQNEDTSLLTSTQFNSFQSFFQESETVLIQMLVSAKNGQ